MEGRAVALRLPLESRPRPTSLRPGPEPSPGRVARAACRDTRPAPPVLPACAAAARSAFFPRWWRWARGDCRRRQSRNLLQTENLDAPRSSRSRTPPPPACASPLPTRRSRPRAAAPPSVPRGRARSSSQPSPEQAGPQPPGVDWQLRSGGWRRARGFLRPRRPLSRPWSPEKEARVPHEPLRWRQRKGTRWWRAEAAGEGDDDQ